jgi:hypothetical protein
MNETFLRELTSLLNRYSIDNECDTPDFILAEYLKNCLDTYRVAIHANMGWSGWPNLSTRLGIGQTLKEKP